jgi:predicted nucleic acid-binding Zn ribbon protein
MPTYVSKCHACGAVHEYIRKVDQRNDVPLCCGQATEKQLQAPQISAMAFSGHKGFMLHDGKNGGKGTWIETGADYKRYLNQTGSVPAHEGQQEASRVRAEQVKQADKKRRQAVVDAVNKAMP